MKFRKSLAILLVSGIIMSGAVCFADGQNSDDGVGDLSKYKASDPSTESTTESNNIDTDSLSNMMDQMDSKYKTTEAATVDPNYLSQGGNHGGTSMTLNDFKNMVNENSDAFNNTDNDTMFNYMKNSLDKGEDVNLSDAFKSSTGLTIPDNFMYDLSSCGMDGTLDASSINLEYGKLLNNINSSYDTKIEDLSSCAMDASTLFTNTYGDLASKLQTDEATLPSDFSFKKISESAKKSMSEGYKDVTKDSNYNSIKDSVNTKNVFDKASKNLTMPDLLSTDDLNNLNSSYKSDLENNWNSKTSTSKKNNADEYNSNKNSLDASAADSNANINSQQQNIKDEQAKTKTTLEYHKNPGQKFKEELKNDTVDKFNNWKKNKNGNSIFL